MPISLPRSSSILALFIASALVVSTVSVLSLDHSVDFRSYFAGVNPIPAAILICLLGGVALLLLEKRFCLLVLPARFHWQNIAISAGAAVPFMVSVTLLDLTLSFPADINVEIPSALSFYPAMGFLAQLSLHIVPFTLILWLFSHFFASSSFQARIWLAIIIAASPEALFQMNVSLGDGGNAILLGSLVAIQLFLFGIVELYLYRRFDFVCMYVFRLTYYGYWHVIWGTLRLN